MASFQPCYADRAISTTVEVVENAQLARDTFRLRLACREMARRFVPGQFLMVRLTGFDDPLLGRPLALYDTVVSHSGDPLEIDIVYLTVGKLTRKLSSLAPGQLLDIWGPLGNGFPCLYQPGSDTMRHFVLVAGGIGQTPFMAMAREVLGLRQFGLPVRRAQKAERVTLCYGVRNREYLAGVDEFRSLGVDVKISTDDGSFGHHGRVTDLLDKVLASSTDCQIVCCGPERMMEAVSTLAAARNTPCLVSLETPMACGIGICFSCVARVRDEGGGWDYRRTCVEGPVFDSRQIIW